MTLRRVLVMALALGALPFSACSGSKSQGPGLDASPNLLDAGAGTLGFMEACATDEQCTTGLCYPFNARGPHCSHPCTVDGDCEAPSPGCNGMGVCKVPQ
jgi:hypothetical protein